MLRELQDYHELRETIQKAALKSQADCDVFFDFSAYGINVYSIERVPAFGNDIEHTLICWYDKEGKHQKWYCWCGHDRHNELVAEFKKSKGKS
jgi:hypothetical protein